MNKPLLWFSVGSAAAGAALLLWKRAGERTTPPIPAGEPSKTYGEATKVTLAVPAGWRRVTGAEVSALPELGSQASALMNTPGFTSMQYGTLTPFVGSDGKTYATWIEQHYHEPGGSAKPWGLHHGVTVLAQASASTLADEWGIA
jgi:hypothetical protein